MLFDTPVYLIFLTAIVTVYWRLSWRAQNVTLLVASYFFYGWWDWRFLSLIAISTVVDYFCAHAISRSAGLTRRRLLLGISITLNLGFLGFFKYFNFFIESFAELLEVVGVQAIPKTFLYVIVPPGISFYTFQAIAYIVDVYQKKLKPADSLVDYALFISLFPHLIAGPIQRPSHLLPQVQSPRTFDDQKFFNGLMLILGGLFRKCVIADNCALLANAAFDGRLGPPSLAVTLIGIYAFAWQIYGDFSGYSNIARGSAQLLGFHFMVNFRQPYLATSLQDFWRRWHISLSTWLRDYLYIPLGGSRNGERKTYRNLMLTMLIGGLWHGANWRFVVWGGIHGLGLAAGRLLGSRRQDVREDTVQPDLLAISQWLRRVWIFHVVCIAWIFFRAESFHEAVAFLQGLTTWTWQPEFGTAFIFLAAFSIPLFIIDLINESRKEEYLFETGRLRYQIATATATVAFLLLFTGNLATAFIYFQF
ncbi:MAG: MBOAT family O-acyltransferase [Gammaproteobacteria bacterium]